MITELTLPELKLGEWLHFTNCGAYSLNLHSEFNGFPKPPKYYKLEKKDRLLNNDACAICFILFLLSLYFIDCVSIFHIDLSFSSSDQCNWPYTSTAIHTCNHACHFISL